MFCDPSQPRKTFPKLKGRAAEIKHLMPALLWVWREFRTPGDAIHDQVELCLQCLVFLDETMDAHRHLDAFPENVAENFQQAGFALSASMNFLLIHFATRRPAEFLFNIVPKNHYLCHIALAAAYINPALGLCYTGEDMMHQMKRLSAGCVKGNGPRIAGRKLMTWYGHALARLLATGQHLL